MSNCTYHMEIFIPSGAVPATMTLIQEGITLRGYSLVQGNCISFETVQRNICDLVITGEAAIPFGRVRFTLYGELRDNDFHAMVYIANYPDVIEISGKKID